MSLGSSIDQVRENHTGRRKGGVQGVCSLDRKCSIHPAKEIRLDFGTSLHRDTQGINKFGMPALLARNHFWTDKQETVVHVAVLASD